MNQRNYDYITEDVDTGGTYHVKIRPTAETAEEWSQETLDTLGSVLDSFESFMEVREATLYFQKAPCDVTRESVVVQRKDRDREMQSIDVENGTGLTSDDIEVAVEQVSLSEEQVPVLAGAYVDEARFHVYLNQGLCSIGADSEYYKVSKGTEIVNDEPDSLPIVFKFSHRDNFWSNDRCTITKYYDEPHEASGQIYDVSFEILSDFLVGTGQEKFPELVRINQARFYECYAALEATNDVLEVICHRGGYPASDYHLAQLVDYEGKPVAELIDDYRWEWVERELRDQAIAREEDGERVLDFGTVGEEVFTEELRRRIEVFLAEEGTETIDRVRVMRQDETTLEGRVEDSSVDWDG